MRTVPKPVIAAVNGPAVGIGCSLALASDLIVAAARSAYFLLAFVNIGLGLDGGASQTLVERVGHARAFEIAYLGERIGAETALSWGLVNQAADDGDFEASAGASRLRLAADLPPPTPPSSAPSMRAYAGFDELLDLYSTSSRRRPPRTSPRASRPSCKASRRVHRRVGSEMNLAGLLDRVSGARPRSRR